MESNELEQEYPTLSFEAARYNMQVLAIGRIIKTLTDLDQSINEGSDSQRSMLEIVQKDLTALLAGNAQNRDSFADLRRVLIATQDALNNLAANLPDRDTIATIGVKNATNDIYSTFEDKLYEFIARIDVQLTPEFGEAVVTLKKAILDTRGEPETAIPTTVRHKLRVKLCRGFDLYQRWTRALCPTATVVVIPLLLFIKLLQLRH